MTRPRIEPHEQRPTKHEAITLTIRPHVRHATRVAKNVILRSEMTQVHRSSKNNICS